MRVIQAVASYGVALSRAIVPDSRGRRQVCCWLAAGMMALTTPSFWVARAQTAATDPLSSGQQLGQGGVSTNPNPFVEFTADLYGDLFEGAWWTEDDLYLLPHEILQPETVTVTVNGQFCTLDAQKVQPIELTADYFPEPEYPANETDNFENLVAEHGLSVCLIEGRIYTDAGSRMILAFGISSWVHDNYILLPMGDYTPFDTNSVDQPTRDVECEDCPDVWHTTPLDDPFGDFPDDCEDCVTQYHADLDKADKDYREAMSGAEKTRRENRTALNDWWHQSTDTITRDFERDQAAKGRNYVYETIGCIIVGVAGPGIGLACFVVLSIKTFHDMAARSEQYLSDMAPFKATYDAPWAAINVAYNVARQTAIADREYADGEACSDVNLCLLINNCDQQILCEGND